ncbi:Stp1/IreP family PP2C-type Ser/Thr phosphatase [Candidatus Galacturonibacter soehngenii]|uniref:Stp1/IreP family PP2C-type Ser/Thr phosphatase n=1 Tax=Candidatus Galacturonatibacter soehngenii TaxID=2307010 RepID=A0A7V7UDM1_9FIRM|nr:Stp1/IreP family PP2C-type Ser/Thr phosphatase [Candidatus Galacturonibacter soehngenii]KAB1440712.1 Stp1/IreP family PP2C-type Ser/Thr phosphatase [Candidatus Galacturonibacter soehngenii]MBA4687472.1 Stp1/IreP family PP2C-type Ser/Thr phosphatase [Candidatus Galacturonibacter soehngenii]
MKTFSITDVGQKRNMNQDYVYTSENPVGNLPNLFVVADGMGGHNAGDFASKYTVKQLIKLIESSEETNPIKIMRQSIELANMQLLQKANENSELMGMGTTLVVATIVKEYIYIANIGDSRLYIINSGIRQITKDHSLVEEMIRLGEIEREDAKNHPDKNIITRAIGAAEEISVDFFEMKLEKEDTILMCSDGLTNMIDDNEICQIIKNQKTPEQKAQKLVETANKNGGKDNIAVIIIEPYVSEVKIC